MERNIQKNGLVNLVVAVLVFLAGFGVTVFAGSLAGQAASIFLGLGVIVAGTLGSYLGATIMYWTSRWLGRPLVLRYGKYVMISPEKLIQSEVFLARYHTGGVFFARLLPVVRHLIGIPAGIVRLPFGVYSAMTLVGSGLWCTVLALFGQEVLGAEPNLINDPEAMVRPLKAKLMTIVIGIVVLAALYVAVMFMTRKKAAT